MTCAALAASLGFGGYTAAEDIDLTEQKIRALIAEGKSLADARRELGYHSLQTRRK